MRWAEKMFNDGKDLSHDFGNDAADEPTARYRFTITNIYAVPMEIRTEIKPRICGCTTATAVQARVLQPKSRGTIDVMMDGRQFTGSKTVEVKVTRSVRGVHLLGRAEGHRQQPGRPSCCNPGEVTFGTDVAGRGRRRNRPSTSTTPGRLPVESNRTWSPRTCR